MSALRILPGVFLLSALAACGQTELPSLPVGWDTGSDAEPWSPGEDGDGGWLDPEDAAAGIPDASQQSGADVGQPIWPDASAPRPDASYFPPDAGAIPPDAGTMRPDASTPRPDAGPIPPDAGTMRPDASTPPPDAGTPITTTEANCEVLVVGGGLGGVAAAHEAASSGADTCLVASVAWLGGQATSQGVSALDEGFVDGWYGFAEPYAEFRQQVRDDYLSRYSVRRPSNEPAEPGAFDPGSCWVSRLCYEPKVAVSVIDRMLGQIYSVARLRIFRGWSPASVNRSGAAVTGVEFRDATGNILKVRARVTLDATELGDLLPLAGAAFRTGRESYSDTGEPSAGSADPECVQPFTYTFALERMPDGESHLIPRPAGYDASRYGLGSYKVFPPASAPDNWAFWNYRRLVAAANFSSGPTRDLAMINWGAPGGNDFDRNCGTDGCNLIGKPPAQAARILQRGRDHALGFVYYLQRDVPRDDGLGRGYPNLKLRADVMGTADGLSMEPYIRESRRIRALTLVREQDVAGPATERGTLYDDVVGIAHYNVDIHPCARGEPPVNGSAKASHLPLGALIPESLDGLLAAAKNLGTTHISNGAYRVHPVEWAVGQAAGAAAALAVRWNLQPRQLRADKAALRRLQHHLASGRGGALFWWTDLSRTDPLWVPAMMMGATSVMVGSPGDLRFHPDQTLLRGQAAVMTTREFGIPPVTACRPTFSDVPCSHYAYGAIQAMADRGLTSGIGNGLFAPDDPIRRTDFSAFLVRAAGWTIVKPASASYSDVPTTHPMYGFVETAKAHGLYQGETSGRTFSPDSPTTRRAAAFWVYNHQRSVFGF